MIVLYTSVSLTHTWGCTRMVRPHTKFGFFHPHGEGLVVPTQFPRNSRTFLSIFYLFQSIFTISPTQNFVMVFVAPTQKLDVSAHPHTKVRPSVRSRWDRGAYMNLWFSARGLKFSRDQVFLIWYFEYFMAIGYFGSHDRRKYSSLGVIQKVRSPSGERAVKKWIKNEQYFRGWGRGETHSKQWLLLYFPM